MAKNNKGGKQTPAQRKAAERNFGKYTLLGISGNLHHIGAGARTDRERTLCASIYSDLHELRESWDDKE